MTVIVIVAGPEGLRGHLTRWMVEVQAWVFVGNPGRRIRDHLWQILAERIGSGQVVMIEPAQTEQGWAVRTAGTDRWAPVDFDGVTLVARRRLQKH